MTNLSSVDIAFLVLTVGVYVILALKVKGLD